MRKEAKEMAKFTWANGHVNRDCHVGNFSNFNQIKGYLKGIKIEVVDIKNV